MIKNYTQFNESVNQKLYKRIILLSAGVYDQYANPILPSYNPDLHQDLSEEDINHIKTLTKLNVEKRMYRIQKKDVMMVKILKRSKVERVISKNIFITKLPDDYFIVQYNSVPIGNGPKSWIESYVLYVDGWDGLQQLIKDFDFYED